MSKNYVGVGYEVCPVCGSRHGEAVLIDKRLKESLEPDNFLGFNLCPEHKKMEAEYLALVVVTYVPERVSFREQFNGAKRTGEVIHMRRTLAADFFNVDTSKVPMLWIDPEAAALIKDMQEEA